MSSPRTLQRSAGPTAQYWVEHFIPDLFTIQAVNKIYGDTEFDAGKYSHTGHTFEVQRIKIYNSSDCTGSHSTILPNTMQRNKTVFVQNSKTGLD